MDEGLPRGKGVSGLGGCEVGQGLSILHQRPLGEKWKNGTQDQDQRQRQLGLWSMHRNRLPNFRDSQLDLVNFPVPRTGPNGGGGTE